MKAIFIAFAMYSKIPVPRTEWNEKNMRYAMCYFPLVGAVVAGILILMYRVCDFLSLSGMLRGSILASVPILVTGGIHMDGFLDTVDARNSFGDREKKLQILKDPHVGSFALIKGILYIILQVGFFSQLSYIGMQIYSIMFVWSRALSGLALCNFKNAKKDGLLVTFKSHAHSKMVSTVMLLYMVLFFIGDVSYIILRQYSLQYLVAGVVMCMSSLCLFVYYRIFSYREFEGITGDLAGYFLQLVEIVALIIVVIVEKAVIWF